VILSEQTKDSS